MMVKHKLIKNINKLQWKCTCWEFATTATQQFHLDRNTTFKKFILIANHQMRKITCKLQWKCCLGKFTTTLPQTLLTTNIARRPSELKPLLHKTLPNGLADPTHKSDVQHVSKPSRRLADLSPLLHKTLPNAAANPTIPREMQHDGETYTDWTNM